MMICPISWIAAAWLTVAVPTLVEDTPKPLDTSLGQQPPENAIVLFDGEDLADWSLLNGDAPSTWSVDDGAMVVGKGNIRTIDQFEDFQLHVEFWLPYMPDARGQARSNSGVYLLGRYEVQVLDSYGLEDLQSNDCGAIYKQATPPFNVCKPPETWQTYDITFRKARLAEDGSVAEKARITVLHNGIKTIDDLEVSPTPGGIGTEEGVAGPILLQDHGNPVQFRNIWLVPLDD